MHLTKVFKFAWPVIHHFSGIIKLSNVNNAQQHSFMMVKFLNVSVLYKLHINIMVDASNVNNQTFGTQKQNNVNGVHKLLYIKK